MVLYVINYLSKYTRMHARTHAHTLYSKSLNMTYCIFEELEQLFEAFLTLGYLVVSPYVSASPPESILLEA